MEKKRVKKERPFIVSGTADGIGRFSYRVETFNYALAHIKATKRLQGDHPGKLIKLIGQMHIEQIHVEKEKLDQQLVLPLSKS